MPITTTASSKAARRKNDEPFGRIGVAKAEDSRTAVGRAEAQSPPGVPAGKKFRRNVWLWRRANSRSVKEPS